MFVSQHQESEAWILPLPSPTEIIFSYFLQYKKMSYINMLLN